MEAGVGDPELQKGSGEIAVSPSSCPPSPAFPTQLISVGGISGRVACAILVGLICTWLQCLGSIWKCLRLIRDCSGSRWILWWLWLCPHHMNTTCHKLSVHRSPCYLGKQGDLLDLGGKRLSFFPTGSIPGSVATEGNDLDAQIRKKVTPRNESTAEWTFGLLLWAEEEREH